MVLSAYSDGSVTGRGVAGSAAIVIETADGEVVATIRLAPMDVALSSGRTGWIGLVMVLIAAASHLARVQEFDRGAERSVMLKGRYGRCEN